MLNFKVELYNFIISDLSRFQWLGFRGGLLCNDSICDSISATVFFFTILDLLYPCFDLYMCTLQCTALNQYLLYYAVL